MKMLRKWTVCIVLSACLGISVYHFLSFGAKCLYPYVVLKWFPKLVSDDNTDVTIVTAYFDLGDIQKGINHRDDRSPQTYVQWASAFLFLQNPLVIFTDSKELADMFQQTARTRVKVIHLKNRTNFKTFHRLLKVRQIFADPDYPKFSPNTILPEYSCSQHAKFEAVATAIARNDFGTKYFAWLDLGYFRDITFRQKKFWITVPHDMDDSKVAACQVRPQDMSKVPEDIFKTNEFWVGGGMFLAHRHTFSAFIADYGRALDFFLERGLANTDQQVLYAMYTPSVREALRVTSQLQVFTWPWNFFSTCWFYLGYSCYREQ